jgi:hypothetical protein
MDLCAEISRIEAAAARRSIPVRAILKRAGLANSNWARWKKGKTSPSVRTWSEVTAAADSLFSAPKTPAPDSTAGHAGGSSPHPIPDIEQSPPIGADRAAAPVEAGG